jgi:hypothetical protein
MILPPVTAEVSLYKSAGHYRSSSPAGSARGVVPSQFGLPQGSYQRSCLTGGCTYNGFRFYSLSCTCIDKNGLFQYSTLSAFWTPLCSGRDIANCNGVLTCGPCPR